MRVFLFAVLLFFLMAPAKAEGRIYCPLPEDGIWINENAKAKQISRIEIETKCVDDTVQARMRAFTKCIPRDCKWGWNKAELRDYGGLRSDLMGFLTAKVLFVRNFQGYLDVRLIEVPHDPNLPQSEESYTLTRAKL
ncbi:putative serine/threonine kinase protein [Roseibium sp. TrichSKD4]|uniref:hypothetical protein n=1 Tax=Roseibium sp. TrichSKD4 TaxID=744980 RepID=UPI0001E56707|nr:hypothetical protein [Roseibium sp. TrichSKD4]EFO32826.1 putative serine/threonine kinase protein [Roseibium sp. TrichSKD4]